MGSCFRRLLRIPGVTPPGKNFRFDVTPPLVTIVDWTHAGSCTFAVEVCRTPLTSFTPGFDFDAFWTFFKKAARLVNTLGVTPPDFAQPCFLLLFAAFTTNVFEPIGTCFTSEHERPPILILLSLHDAPPRALLFPPNNCSNIVGRAPSIMAASTPADFRLEPTLKPSS